MTNNKAQLLLKRNYSLLVLCFFCLGVLFELLFRVLLGSLGETEPLGFKYYVFYKYLGFLLINHILFRPLTLRYWLIYHDSTKVKGKPAFQEIAKGLSLLEKLFVTAGCVMWLYILVLWLFPIPELLMSIKLHEGLKKMGLVTFIVGVCIGCQCKLSGVDIHEKLSQ